jgi:hypothetical protein
MCISYVKKLFSNEVISEIYMYMIERHHLDVSDVDLEGPDSQKINLQQRQGQTDPSVMCNRVNDFLAAYPILKNAKSAQCLQFLITAKRLFINLLMHKGCGICKKTVMEMEKQICTHMKKLQTWQQFSLTIKNQKQKTWTDIFLATDTYNTVNFAVRGFLAYTKDAIKHTQDGFYVPVLRSNTSSLKALFAQIQTASVHTGTSLSQYSAHLKTMNVRSMVNSLKAGRTYDPEDAEQCTAVREFETINAKKNESKQRKRKWKG